ncbi:patatin-like phospholipase family protein [Methylovirgula sp. 4M-Z18]|uniref:patatin-like phospholipase family protein n=1 Tax=Methylovirgula sp. 4M-Z18 TaxID=2293567 RepID=UPI000E2EC162|nr:patatin-like phospholipase family protein [Methylovirgula sp. 4M-Z18]RFB79217.1 patatin-like phospholipase family protein [Methylovirgula sp. 4M-Z18]
MPASTPTKERPQSIAAVGQVVLVLQGGGALGAYQAGVYEALHEAGIEPDWVIGTSIGAINASLIAGNAVANRLARLRDFWRRVEQPDFFTGFPWAARSLPNLSTVTAGIPGFFAPNPMAFLGPHMPMRPEAAGYYSTGPLAQTLQEFVDFAVLNQGVPRLTVGAAHVTSGQMRYFDSRDMPLDARHIMASGALPPAFPAVRIDDELYWDGGILSNTPVEAVFDDVPRRDSLIFSIHIWNPRGSEPHSIWDVMNRHKDIQYSSRTDSHILRQRQIHRLRHIIAELAAKLPEDQRALSDVQRMAAFGCLTRMHVVRLLAPTLQNEDHTKDIDFTPGGISKRWRAGYVDTQKLLAQAPWQAEVDPLEGFCLHEIRREPTDESVTKS